MKLGIRISLLTFFISSISFVSILFLIKKNVNLFIINLHTIRPVATHTPLIQALLALALSNESEDEQLKL